MQKLLATAIIALTLTACVRVVERPVEVPAKAPAPAEEGETR